MQATEKEVDMLQIIAEVKYTTLGHTVSGRTEIWTQASFPPCSAPSITERGVT